jgi:hypothetical protein
MKNRTARTPRPPRHDGCGAEEPDELGVRSLLVRKPLRVRLGALGVLAMRPSFSRFNDHDGLTAALLVLTVSTPER